MNQKVGHHSFFEYFKRFLSNKSNERFFFIAILLLNLVPILITPFFPTLDGPAHAHNAKLISQLIFGEPSVVNDFYTLNPFPVPNWSGHALLLFFQWLLPAYLAEKALLILIALGIPLAFRSLIRSVSPNQLFLSYFAFPLTYSVLFYMGFHNFLIGITFMLFSMSFWFKYCQNMSRKFIVYFALLLTLTYFSHLLTFGLLILFLFASVLWNSLVTKENPFKSRKSGLVALLVSSFIPIVLTILYFASRPDSGVKNHIDVSEKMQWIYDFKSIMIHRIENFNLSPSIFFYVLAGLSAYLIYSTIKSFRKSKNQNRTKYAKNAFWLIWLLFIFALYIILPDSDDYNGFISIRLLLFLFIFLVILLTVANYPVYVKTVTISIVLLFQFRIHYNNLYPIKELNEIATDCFWLSRHVEKNNVVLPVNLLDNWLTMHISNYFGVRQPIVLLENYEPANQYFPLKWNFDKMPHNQVGEMSITEDTCIPGYSNPLNKSRKIDYVLIIGNMGLINDQCKLQYIDTIKLYYKLVEEKGHCSLYKRIE